MDSTKILLDDVQTAIRTLGRDVEDLKQKVKELQRDMKIIFPIVSESTM